MTRPDVMRSPLGSDIDEMSSITVTAIFRLDGASNCSISTCAKKSPKWTAFWRDVAGKLLAVADDDDEAPDAATAWADGATDDATLVADTVAAACGEVPAAPVTGSG